MITLDRILPSSKSWRELWLAQNISGVNWPSSVKGGQPITLTNAAAKRTTAEGVHFVAGVNTSNIKYADPHDAVNDLWISFRFKLDQDFSTSNSTDMYLASKYVNSTSYWYVWLKQATGKLVMEHREANGTQTIVSAETSWTAGTWYHCLVSCNTGVGQRLIIDGGTVVTAGANTEAISLAIDLTIGARDDGTSTEGFEGVISDVVIGGGADNALTTTANTGEEALLAKGIPPASAKVTNLFTLDEGRGTTANDRGSGADDGTLDTSCTWAFTTKQAVMSLDGINDYGTSSSGVRINGETSVIWVGKLKSSYATIGSDAYLLQFYIDGDDSIAFIGDTAGTIDYYVEGSGTPKTLTHTVTHSIDDNVILIGTVTTAGVAVYYVNGVATATDTGVGDRAGTAATAYLGAEQSPGNYDVSQPILVGLIDGALTGQEAFSLSRYLNNRLKLGLTI